MKLLVAPSATPATGPPAILAPSLRGGDGQIRPLRRADIPAVVALRHQLFRHTTRPTAEALGAFFERVFLRSPWKELALPSLVHLDETGEVNGFVGIVPRAMQFDGRTIRVAVPTQLMMRPGASPGSALRLVHGVFEGPQDLTLSDVAIDPARRLWDRVGGATALSYSLSWTLALQPAREILARFARTPLRRAVAYLLRPASHLLDREKGATQVAAGCADLVSEPFDPVHAVDQMNEITATWSLHPVYDPIGLAWILDELARKVEQGPLEARSVRDRRGHLLGWFLYYANRGGVGEVLQLGARPGDQGKILASLIAHAKGCGVVALAGRVEPSAAPALAEFGARFTREGPWFLTYARDPRLLAAVLRGAGFLSRLEGEWWLNF